MKLFKPSKLLLTLLGAAIGLPSYAATQLEPYTFIGPQGEAVEALKGSFKVPENRSNPESRQIELQFIKFPATTDRPGSPIVYLSGGPGGSATWTAKRARFPLFMRMRQHADVILFDQRGTGLSNQLESCSSGPGLSMANPLTIAALTNYLEHKIAHCRKKWHASGVDLNGYTTKESAADLVQLAAQLETPRLNLWGISYGTHLALATAKYHPDIIHRMIFASTEGLSQTIKLPRYNDDLLKRINAAVEADDAAKQQYAGWLPKLIAVLERLEKAPVIITSKNPDTGETIELGIGKLDVQLLLSYIMLKNPDTIQQVPALVLAMHAGDFTHAAAPIADIRHYFHQLNPMALAMDAASGISDKRWKEVLEQANGAVLGRAGNLPFPDINDALGVKDLGDDFRAPLVSNLPTLFFSGNYDGRTYIEEQKMVAEGFSNKAFIVLDGAGHDLFMSTPEVGDLMLDFLNGEMVESRRINVGPLKFR